MAIMVAMDEQPQQQHGRSKSSNKDQSKLLHPLLNELPLLVRFPLSGVLGNAIFLAAYNQTLQIVDWPASTVFAVVQFGCIFVNHWLNISLVFGWPDNYVVSLAANAPVGLSALGLGAWITSTLEAAAFDLWLAEQVPWLLDPAQQTVGGFWTSIVVMIATGLFSYVALTLVNAKTPADDEAKKKKEL